MTDRVLSVAQMRAADEYTINTLGVRSEELMRRAGCALAEEVFKIRSETGGEVLIVCGTGNNGGDGFVCARELLNRGVPVKVYAVEGNYSADCEREKDRYKGDYSRDICGAIIVDCLFGTGLAREVVGVNATVINQINSAKAVVVSADIPSGLNGDNGLISGVAVKAALTVAIGEFKFGHFLNDGIDFCGKLIKRDIGIVCPEKNYAQVNYPAYMAQLFPERRRNSHKGTYGTAQLYCGSKAYCGAAVLSAQGALKSGCGFLKLATDEKLKYAMVVKFPQIIYNERPYLSAEAIVVGCGSGVSEELYNLIKNILDEYSGKLVLDADALNSLSKYGVAALKRKKCKVIITPHIGEFSRLTGLPLEGILKNPVMHAKEFAEEYGVTVLLKSATSVITDGRRVALNARGTTALAKGGSGDILAGFLCGTLARGLDPFEGAVAASISLGVAAEIASEEKGDYCATAQDIIKNLHFAVTRLTR